MFYNSECFTARNHRCQRQRLAVRGCNPRLGLGWSNEGGESTKTPLQHVNIEDLIAFATRSLFARHRIHASIVVLLVLLVVLFFFFIYFISIIVLLFLFFVKVLALIPIVISIRSGRDVWLTVRGGRTHKQLERFSNHVDCIIGFAEITPDDQVSVGIIRRAFVDKQECERVSLDAILAASQVKRNVARGRHERTRFEKLNISLGDIGTWSGLDMAKIFDINAITQMYHAESRTIGRIREHAHPVLIGSP
mmetsp:Transcript_6286/g.11333  ORF Transcript_6286/g.11333 Transcript_6286/m.11333 type:complete len:250 (-) Transcript_6286:367-1116(-)